MSGALQVSIAIDGPTNVLPSRELRCCRNTLQNGYSDFLAGRLPPQAIKLARLGKQNSSQATIVEATMTDTDGEILTLDEVAAYLKAGKRTVYRLARKGEIPAFKLGGTWRFRRSELDLWIAESINKKKPEAS